MVRPRWALLALLAVPVVLAAAGIAAGRGAEPAQTCTPGVRSLELRNGRQLRVRITPGGRGGRKAIVLAFHGAGQRPSNALFAFRAWDAPGLVLAAPASKGRTWSALSGSDADLESVNLALERLYGLCPVRRERIVVGGFSDGATFALSLGLASGDLFRSIVAFSPGGIVGDGQAGRPRVFVSHGTSDPILPIGRTSRPIVRRLRAAGYPVTYRTFRGGHEVPPTISRAAQSWFLAAG